MVIRQTNVNDVVTADVLGQQGIATLRQVVAAQEQTARLVAVGATATPIATVTLPGTEPTDPDAPRKLRAFDVLPVPGADYYREEVILRGTSGIADAVYVCLQVGDDSYTWRLVAGGGPDIGLYTSMVLDDAVTGPLIFLRAIKTGMVVGNTEAALRIEAGDSTDINGLATDLNLGAFFANYTKNGTAADFINYGEGDATYTQTRWTGGGGIGHNVWQGYDSGAGNTVTGQGINIERYGVGEGLRQIAKAGSSTSPLMYSVVEATVNTPVWSVLDNGITSADGIAWTQTARTSGNLVSIFHSGSNWATGYAWLMNLGNGGGGAFGGKFLGFLKAGVEKFSVDDDGSFFSAQLAALPTSLLKVTTTTGALSAAVAADLPSGIVATKIGGGTVDDTEFGYLNGVTSAIQTQLDAMILAAGDTMSGTLTLDGATAAILNNSKVVQARKNAGTAFNMLYIDSGDTLKIGAIDSGSGVTVGLYGGSVLGLTIETDGRITPGIYIKKAVTAKTTTYTATLVDEVILCTAASGWTLTLPAASTATGKEYIVKKTDNNANAITLDGNGAETIDGATTFALAAQWKFARLICNGTAWFIAASN